MSSDNTSTESKPGTGRAIALRVGATLGAVLLVAWLSTCFLFVDETEIVIVEKLGEVTAVLDQEEDRGLNIKAPWPIGNVRRFDRRIQLFDPAGREVFTRDRKNILADAYVCWRIAEPRDGEEISKRPVLRFLRSLGSPEMAQARLETRLRSTLATQIAQVELTSLMFVTDRESPPVEVDNNAEADADADNNATDKNVDNNNDNMTTLDGISRELLTAMRQRTDESESVRDQLGIEIVDVRIKRLSFPRGNQQAVFERMKSERRKIADRYRSAGLAENTKIRSQADRQYSEILSSADAEAERIRGEAEAKALAILNEAHARDPDFYRIVKTLDSYETILNEKTTLVLSASSSLLKLLVEGIPEDLPSRPPATLDDTGAEPVETTSGEKDSTDGEVEPASGGDPGPETPELNEGVSLRIRGSSDFQSAAKRRKHVAPGVSQGKQAVETGKPRSGDSELAMAACCRRFAAFTTFRIANPWLTPGATCFRRFAAEPLCFADEQSTAQSHFAKQSFEKMCSQAGAWEQELEGDAS